MRPIFIIFLISIACVLPAFTQVASGGAYLLDQAVVSNGSGKAIDVVDGKYTTEHTLGQPATGTSAGGRYAVRGGFWQQSLLPSAAGITISGRVTTSEGRGIRSTIVILTNSQGMAWRVMTTARGTYSFSDVESGQTYVMTVTSRRFQFTPRIVDVIDNLTDIDFVASP